MKDRPPAESPPQLQLVADALGLLQRANGDEAGLWARSAAFLGRQALEEAIAAYFTTKKLDPSRWSFRDQLTCLLELWREGDTARRASHTWWALSTACHYHAYELPPTARELRGWLDEAGRLAHELETG